MPDIPGRACVAGRQVAPDLRTLIWGTSQSGPGIGKRVTVGVGSREVQPARVTFLQLGGHTVIVAERERIDKR